MTDTRPHLLAWARTDRHGAALVTCDAHEVHGHELVTATPAHSFLFSLLLDRGGRTRQACMTVASPTGRRTRDMHRVDGTRWLIDGRPAPHLDGCTEIDIAATPYTNTLAIRHLALARGQDGSLDVAWIDLDLQVQRIRQHYTRLEQPAPDGPHQYRYRNDRSHRAWTLTVDEHDHVIDYEGFARRTSPSRSP